MPQQPQYLRAQPSNQSDFSKISSNGSSSTLPGHVLPSHREPSSRRQQQNGEGSNGYAGARPQATGFSASAIDRSQTSAVKRNLTRAKTLTRPDRHVTPAPLISAANAPGLNSAATGALSRSSSSWWQPWSFYIALVTFWAPGPLLAVFGMKEKAKQRAWKEKVALCSICIVMGGFIGFFTIGLNRTLCPEATGNNPGEFIRLGEQPGYVGVEGWMFSAANASNTVNGINFPTLAQQLSGQDITNLFDTSDDQPEECKKLAGNPAAHFASVNMCANGTGTATCVLNKPTPEYLTSLGLVNSTKRVGWSWEQVVRFPNMMVIDGSVVNLTPYIAAYPRPLDGDDIDLAIRIALDNSTASGGKDATRTFYSRTNLKDAAECMKYRYRAGHIDKITPGCFASQLFLYVSLVVILAVVLARFFMALIFSWFLSARLVQPPKNLKRHAVSPAVMPAGANTSINNASGTAPWTAAANNQRAKTVKRAQREATAARANGKLAPFDEKAAMSAAGPAYADSNGMLSMAAIGAELFCVCLVTCYSEGEEGIQCTLDSIAATDYADSRKLLFVVCDGMITGSGEKMSTPDICVNLIDADPRFENPQAMSYLAVSAGRKQHNMAMVYAGHYTKVKGHRTPTIIVVKTGTPEEANDAKPGNRGKRDSQMILMNFFSRVTYNDRMTPLDYDLFRKTQALMGVTPDFFEVCLMVDADTKAFPDSLKQLVNCMQHDNMIMGVCGETRIANKRQSWVTMIQVYEYFISHHLAKAFESVFGGVTCLPGCFSMYRLKARKANESDWVPVLVHSGIVAEYSQSTVETLHEKNLLLLGEDRFLTTCMLRTFPHRKMMFCPQARCRTIAPDTFKVLLSQRRRWINSTIHNLMELVRVQDLCGTFCFSMQFVVFMDLVGTIVLPVAICLTYSLIVQYIISPPGSFSDAIPLLLLAAVLGLPALLILLATGKVVYVSWMLIYMVSLPIWNFVLPVYAYWHFDDFSWGQTRMVEGEKKDQGHGEAVGDAIELNTVPLRRWEDWERSRLRKLKREAKRKQEFQRAFGTRQFHNANTLSTYTDGDDTTRFDSDAGSMFSSEDDRWGLQIGQYGDDIPPVLPPVGLYHADDAASDGETVDPERMEAMLDQGWDDDETSGQLTPSGSGGFNQYNTPPPGSYGYQQAATRTGGTPVRMYQLTDAGPTHNSNSSLTRLTQDMTDSTASLGSPLSPQGGIRAMSPLGSRPYDYPQPRQLTGNGPESPSRASGFDSNPIQSGRGHVKRRSGGGSGSAAFGQGYQ